MKISKSEPNKIINEATWFENAQKKLEIYSKGLFYKPFWASYEMERLKSIKLRDLLIHIDRSTNMGPNNSKIKSFLNICKNSKIASSSFWNKLVGKTLIRRPDLELFVDELSNLIHLCKVDCESTIYHGDLHLNNMFFDFQLRIDGHRSRGELYGHWLYDLAKLTHSFIGKFDFIDANFF